MAGQAREQHVNFLAGKKVVAHSKLRQPLDDRLFSHQIMSVSEAKCRAKDGEFPIDGFRLAPFKLHVADVMTDREGRAAVDSVGTKPPAQAPQSPVVGVTRAIFESVPVFEHIEQVAHGNGSIVSASGRVKMTNRACGDFSDAPATQLFGILALPRL